MPVGREESWTISENGPFHYGKDVLSRSSRDVETFAAPERRDIRDEHDCTQADRQKQVMIPP
jgi:hypothetical protein